MSTKTYSLSEARMCVSNDAKSNMLSDTTGRGEIVIYTGLYRWADGSIRDTQERKCIHPAPMCETVSCTYWDDSESEIELGCTCVCDCCSCDYCLTN